MIDMHAHILPGVDDGARNMEEALRMAALSRQSGIRTIVATPHFGTKMLGVPELAESDSKDADKEIEIEVAVPAEQEDGGPWQPDGIEENIVEVIEEIIEDVAAGDELKVLKKEAALEPAIEVVPDEEDMEVPEKRCNEIIKAVAALRVEMVKWGMEPEAADGVEILPGSEVFCTVELMPRIIECLYNGWILTINATRYVLIETDYEAEYDEILDIVDRLVEAGYWPLMAHVEEYECLYKNIDRLDELFERGVRFQVNGSSFTSGKLSKKARWARTLLEYDLIHALGSDCHGADERKPDMMEAVEWIGRKYGDEVVDDLLHNAEKIIRGEFIGGEILPE